MSLTPSVEEARPVKVKPKSAKTSREVVNNSPQTPETNRRPNTCEGLGSSGLELSLLRDSQTVQAYFGPIAKLPSPTSWASRTAASCALSKKQSEEIMELKRQLAHTNQDLHMTKISRSLSHGNGSAAVMAMISPNTECAPGSPYRASSGTSLNSNKPSLSKELMQKLRSMTETIKMLSDENAQLRTQNEEILRAKKEENSRNNRRNSSGLYDDLDKTQLVELVLSYDEKLKALSKEVQELQKKLKQVDEASKEAEIQAGNSAKSTGEKDKYKQLARRLKEERNTYRDNLEAKQKEQSDLKEEMEKMSELISELRINCQTLQSELSEVRSISKDRTDACVQVDNYSISRPQTTRKMSGQSSISQESIRKARSVYGAKQPKPRYLKENNNEPNQTQQKKNLRSTSMSPSKSGPKIAKPVIAPKAKPAAPVSSSPSNSGSSSRLPMSPASNISSTTSARTTPSRIPQPENCSPRKSRIPSAPRYFTPNRGYTKNSTPNTSPASVASAKICTPPLKKAKSPEPVPEPVEEPQNIHPRCESVTSSGNSSLKTSSPPPPPPPTQMEVEEEATPKSSPQLLPPPGPPVSQASHPQAKFSSEDEEEIIEEEILRVTSGEDGKVEMLEMMESPIIPLNMTDSPIIPNMTKYSVSPSSSEAENPSADDENESKTTSEADGNSVDCTPRTKKKVEHFRQGLAARRIQRTWKHFYEELEERKDVRDELPAPLVQVIEEKAKLEAADTSPLTPIKAEVDKEKAVTTIETAFVDHQRRERALAGMKAKIHTARPWQKSLKANKDDQESSEEELERAYRSLHLRGNDIRAKVSVIKADQDLFTSGKVSEMKAKLNERRANMSKMSDGITEDDDDEDVVY